MVQSRSLYLTQPSMFANKVWCGHVSFPKVELFEVQWIHRRNTDLGPQWLCPCTYKKTIRYNIKRYQFLALNMKYNEKKSYMHHSCMTEIFNILSPVMISSASFRFMYNGTWQWRPITLNSHSSSTGPLFKDDHALFLSHDVFD